MNVSVNLGSRSYSIVVEVGALAGVGERLRGLGVGRRTALVSDHEWVAHAMSLFGWMMPGDAREYPVAKLDEAMAWLGA